MLGEVHKVQKVSFVTELGERSAAVQRVAHYKVQLMSKAFAGIKAPKIPAYSTIIDPARMKSSLDS